MIDQEEIRLLGQPIKITVPGVAGQKLPHRRIYSNYPSLNCGQIYNGYAMCDIYHYSASQHEIFIQVDGNLYKMHDYISFGYPVSQYIEEVQQTVTFDKVRKMALLLYNKMKSIEEELSNKVDKN